MKVSLSIEIKLCESNLGFTSLYLFFPLHSPVFSLLADTFSARDN